MGVVRVEAGKKYRVILSPQKTNDGNDFAPLINKVGVARYTGADRSLVFDDPGVQQYATTIKTFGDISWYDHEIEAVPDDAEDLPYEYTYSAYDEAEEDDTDDGEEE